MRTILLTTVVAALLVVPQAGGASPSGWTVQPVPSPAGVRDASLQSLSCVSADNCTAVGGADAGILTEHWNGTAWHVVPAPEPGSGGDQLGSVSCVGTHFCLAVGFQVPELDGPVNPLVERYNGHSWTVVPGLNPGPGYIDLEAVTCTAVDSCDVTGGTATSFFERPYAVHWNGTTWSNQNPPDPIARNDSELTAISCRAARRCTSVGTDLHAWGDEVGFTEEAVFAMRWNGKRWAEQAQANPTGEDLNDDLAVSCDAVQSCQSVGFWETSDGVLQTLAEHWDGSAWTQTDTPNPTSGGAQLDGVSCPTSACQAVGFASSTAATTPLADLWNGTSWSAEAQPALSQPATLRSVSCWSADGCLAVGTTGTDFNLPFSERYTG